MKTFKNNAERSTARTKDMHTEKISSVSEELRQLQNELPDIDKIKFEFADSVFHKGKELIDAKNINFSYAGKYLWAEPLNLHIVSGERIAVNGRNGSGKTTLIKILLGEIKPQVGVIKRSKQQAVYIDQEYSLIDNTRTVYEQAQQFNITGLQEHEIKIRLNRFYLQKHIGTRHVGS